MGDGSRLQKLLMSEEYLELEDNVLVEGAFIELDKRGDAIKQVLLGLTRDSFIVAKDVIIDYRKFPSVKYDADVDLDINDLELEWIIPVCYIEISRVPHEHVLNILSRNGRHRYYMLTNIGGNEKKQWHVWMERAKYIQDDPYGYVKQLYNQWNDTFDLLDVEDPNKKTNSSSTSFRQGNSGSKLSPSTHHRRRTRAKSIVPENWLEVLGVKTSARNLPTAQSSGDKIEPNNTSKAKITDTKSKKKKKNLRFELFDAKSSTCSCFG
ncbi:uncharacterized protein LOC110445444 [Mizuhopecten yessoensis]|uniref:Uncharacterized protein n=1 Tax=Mizuhopecten yessoensis TaxID=6573 RepID=A0A210QZV3_MIZYE|nr:uncharacterized protein LOC110445444 [Mizuhopecten yessoensis]OWF54195.1 hypothetical protein KP79_PYT18939 [Mizuhopecten yessoensis]